MKLFFLTFITFLFFTPTAVSQIIHYSNNRLYNTSGYQYHIIGEVNNNIIVWKTSLSKHHDADILVYDNSMKLINTIDTKILQSDEDANPQFFVAGNTFQLIYEYKTQNALLFKHVVFSKDGNIIRSQILDSITVEDFANRENIFYQTFPFHQNKAACFIKMTDDIKNHLLKFSCCFLNESDTSRKFFTVSFDENHENLANVFIDNDKNVLLLKQQKLDSSVNLKLIKIVFSRDFMLTSDKTISKYFFKANSMQIAKNAGGYVVSGVLKKENRINAAYIENEGLYVWQVDYSLNDAPGDTLLNKEGENDMLTYNSNASDKTFSNVFAVCNIYRISMQIKTPYRAYSWQYVNPSWQSGTATSPSYFLYDNAGLFIGRETDFFDSPYSNSSTSLPNRYGYNLPYKKMELFKLNNNNAVIWQNSFTDSIDNITSANFNNARIIAGDKALHIIYEVLVKKRPRSLNHITISPDGTSTNKLFTAWNTKYQYILSEGVLTNKGEFVVPIVFKSGKLKFAKMKLE